MRRVGIGLLGFIGGVLLAIIVQDVLAGTLSSGGPVPAGLKAVFGFLLPVLALLGILTALLLDNRFEKRRRGGRSAQR